MAHKKVRKHAHKESRVPASYVEYDMPVSVAGRIEAHKHHVTRHVKQAHRCQRVAEMTGGRVRKHRGHHSHAMVLGGSIHHPSYAHPHANGSIWANSGKFPNVGNTMTVVGSRFAH